MNGVVMAAPTMTSDSSAAKAMETLTAQWYNAVIAGCELDPDTFQLAQGFQLLGNTSESLWNTFDAVPPKTLTHYWNPAQINNFSSTYGGVVNNLIPQNSNRFQQIMGDYYAQWNAYLHTSPQPKIPAGGILELFQEWEQLNMPPDLGQSAYTAYQEVAQGVVPIAVQKWIDAGGGASGTKAYNATIEDLRSKITPATPGARVAMNSSTTSKDVTHTWAQGEAGGVFDFFMGGGSADWDKLTAKVSSAGVEIDAEFTHLATFTTGPLAQPSSDPTLKAYKPWYYSDAINLAYHNDDYFVWNQTPPSWAETFGPSGNLRYLTTSIVVVSGVTVTTTSAASFDESEKESVKASAEFGFFPFFEAEASGGWTHHFEFHDSGGFTVTSTVPEGVPVILGAIVTPVSSIFG
jgi:hypothetical protein